MQYNSTSTTRTTALSKGTSDLFVLKYMRQRVRFALYQSERFSASTYPIVSTFKERHERIHRIALYNCQALAQHPTLTFVGFISRRQQEVEQTIVEEIHATDAKLVAGLTNNPGVLGYSSLELRTGIWCNLVLMENIEAKQQVLSTQAHAHAAYQLSPHYYEWIRLHTGVMPQGLFADEMKALHTRFYTFQEKKPVVREQVYVHNVL